MSVNWSGTSQMRSSMSAYEMKVKQAIKQIGQYWAAVFESYAKENAPWTDQTANARQSLHAWVEELANDTVAVWLSHGMDYGKYLETKGASESSHAGRYAIVWPTIEQHLSQIQKMLKEIFG